jgi:hypothetical protein
MSRDYTTDLSYIHNELDRRDIRKKFNFTKLDNKTKKRLGFLETDTTKFIFDTLFINDTDPLHIKRIIKNKEEEITQFYEFKALHGL